MNQNAALIQEKEKARRDDLKKQSEKDKERNKMLLDKQKQQKLDKDAENKKKSAKKERKRGWPLYGQALDQYRLYFIAIR